MEAVGMLGERARQKEMGAGKESSANVAVERGKP